MKPVFLLAAAGILLGLPPALRLLEIRDATRSTTEFCQSVRAGDDLGGVLERARSGLDRGDERRAGTSLNVIFEERAGVPNWPRYVIWTGPLYGRVYCSIEPSGEDRVGAVHLGPLDADAPGFFEDWLSE